MKQSSRPFEEMHSLDQVKHLRDKVYISDWEEAAALQNLKNDKITTFRFDYQEADLFNFTRNNNSQVMMLKEFRNYLKSAFALKDKEELFVEFRQETNETKIEINGFAAADLKTASAGVQDFNFKVYKRLRVSQSVFQVMLALKDVEFVQQYKDVSNAMTLSLFDNITQLGRRMHRQKFGEFFHRILILDLIKTPIQGNKETFVSLCVLLDPNEDNFIDLDSVWRDKGVKGYLGPWKFGLWDFVIKGFVYLRSKMAAGLSAGQCQLSSALRRLSSS